MDSIVSLWGAGIVVLVLFLLVWAVESQRHKAQALYDEVQKKYMDLVNAFRDDGIARVNLTKDGITKSYFIRPLEMEQKAQVVNYQGDKGPKGMYEIRRITQR